MFYYLGRKKRIAGLYPEPTHDTIVEPFAGSGAYALHGTRWERRVVLNDLSPVVGDVWRYLLAASEADILKLPEPAPGTRLSDIASLSEAERWLISFHINPGANQRSDVVTAFNRWPAGRRYIAKNLHKVRHWEVRVGDYRALEPVRATWFVDPPYERTGHHYMTHTVRHAELAAWCRARDGQLIVCENEGAAWLPFAPLARYAICGKSSAREAVYVRPEE